MLMRARVCGIVRVRSHLYVYGRKHAFIHTTCVAQDDTVVLRDKNVKKSQDDLKLFFVSVSILH